MARVNRTHRSRSNDQTIRENAGDLRTKVIRMLGVTILVSWGMFFARFSHAADGAILASGGSPAAVYACATLLADREPVAR
jgi:hypothetical protein